MTGLVNKSTMMFLLTPDHQGLKEPDPDFLANIDLLNILPKNIKQIWPTVFKNFFR
jgi:hypothetical protein